jgi:hypothetical protein
MFSQSSRVRTLTRLSHLTESLATDGVLDGTRRTLAPPASR